MSSFVENRLAELPVFLDGPEGQAFARAMGKAQENEMQLLRIAALSRLAAHCPDDALDAVGGWLGLPRITMLPTLPPGPEPDGTAVPPMGYRGRLVQAWDTYEQGGSKDSIVQALNEIGLPDVVVLHDFEVSPPYPGSWYSRFQVKVGSNSGGTGGYAWTALNLPTTTQLILMRRLMLRWKAAHSYPVEVVITMDDGNTFTLIIGPIIGHGFIIGKSRIGGFDTI